MGFHKQTYSNIDGAFLMGPDGDIRAFQSWPCDGICGTSALPRVVIDDLQYDGPGNDNDNPNVEWVRIKNVGRLPVDLLDWGFVSKPYVLYSTVSSVLHHNDTVMLYIGNGSDSQSAMYSGKEKSILNNEGDSLALISRNGDVVACRAWGDDACARPAPRVMTAHNRAPTEMASTTSRSAYLAKTSQRRRTLAPSLSSRENPTALPAARDGFGARRARSPARLREAIASVLRSSPVASTAMATTTSWPGLQARTWAPSRTPAR